MPEKRRTGGGGVQDPPRRRRGSGDPSAGARYYSAGDAESRAESGGADVMGGMRDLHSFPGFPRHAASSASGVRGLPPGIAQRAPRVDKLPAHMIGPQLQRRLEFDRVVFVQGYTGSGKSSQIPQILLDGPKPWFTSGDGKVLCTQPRRLAVAAVARRVAQERSCKLGEEVGYAIGQQSLRSARTRLLFSTAGIALEMLRAVGPEALLDFAVVIVDEIHERSEQSDLLLTCLREYMLHDKRLRSLRLVLMSATFDRVRYTQYFQDLGDGGKPMQTIPIPKSVGKMLGQHLHIVKTKYLQDAIELLDIVEPADGTGAQEIHKEDEEFSVASPLCEAERQLAWNFDPDTEENTVTRTMHHIIARLLFRLHGPGNVDAVVRCGAAAAAAGEDGTDSTALVFLPTYRALEEQHQLLSQLGCFRLAVLHSSVDIEESLRSIGALGEDNLDSASFPTNEEGDPDQIAAELRKRKVILATNVAESSLTIPGVSLVIDLCRRLQVSWDREMGVTKAETKWASKSQCDQRQGRTGRCNAGTVYRLVPQQFFSNGVIQLWEPAELTLSDLAEAALLLATASHRTMRAVERIMSLCIDKPDPRTVSDAIQRLVGWGLLRAKDRKATTFGAVVGQLPVSLQAGRLAVIGCCAGLMQPASVLAAILSTTPEPILKSLGAREEHEESLSRFSGRSVAAADRCGSLLAQLAAFEWWDAAWVDRQRVRKLGVTVADPPSCAACAEILSSADLVFIQEQFGAVMDQSIDAAHAGTSICRDCHAKQHGQHVATGVLTPQGESSEERWCRRESLSLVALRAVRQTAEVVRAVLTKADVRQGLWDPRNRHCPPTLWPARAVERAVDCRLSSVLDPIGDGERVRQLQQLVETVVTPTRSSLGASTDQLRAETERLGVDPVRVPPCKYYSLGGGSCWEGGGPGDSCSFRHITLEHERPPNCPFYFAPGGCRFGSSCRFSHPRAEVLNELRLASKIVAGQPAYQSALASQRIKGRSLRQLLHGKNVMLVGEGDFSFALALASAFPRPARLLASGLDDEEAMVQKYPQWSSTAAALRPLAMVSHGVDATLLGDSESFRDILKSSTVVLDIIGWQFPHGPNEEDSAANGAMVSAFLRGVAAAAWAHNRADEGLRVFITVQGDHVARWNVVRSARDAMWYLEELLAFDPTEFDGYHPKRTLEPLETLQLSRPLTLVFRPCKPVCFGSDATVASGWDTESCDEENDSDEQTLEDAVEDMIGGGVDLDALQAM